jgi:hypothetical protein
MQRNSLQRNFLTPLLSIVVFEPGMFELLEDECHPWKYDNDIAIFWGFWEMSSGYSGTTHDNSLFSRHLFKSNMLLIREYTSKNKSLDE